MKKTFVLSVLVLCMALGLAWSATSSSVPTQEQLRELEAQILGPAANPVPAASCTVSCPFNPEITCSGTSGDCRVGGGKGLTWLYCDGKIRQVCPGL